MKILLLVSFAALADVAYSQSEPAPRTLSSSTVLDIKAELGNIAGVRELPNGEILVSDAGTVTILVFDPKSGAVRKLGRQGQGPNEFGRPGGIYYDADGVTSLVMDRSQPRVLVVDRNGTLTGMRSIQQRGTSRSADSNDPIRIDAALHMYFVDESRVFRPNAGVQDSVLLIRFDVAQQKGDTAAKLFRTKPTTVSTQGRMTFSRTPKFSPADGWSVTSDGSIALVRAVPYRVDWVSPTGQLTTGTTIAFSPVAVTDGDREPKEGETRRRSAWERRTAKVRPCRATR